jgi:D-proline reductase (dithiol) PrdB
VQAELERRGVATASITMLPEITRAVRPPRALAVPWNLGFPLGAAGDADLQTRVVRRLLSLCARADVPVIEEL